MYTQPNRSLKIGLLAYCFVTSVMLAACVQVPAVSPLPSPSAQTATITTSDDRTPAPETPSPTSTVEKSPPPLPTQTPSVVEWQTFAHRSGISFQFPGDLQLVRVQGDEDNTPFSGWLRPFGDWFIRPIYVGVRPLPKEQESTLYFHTGDIVSPEYFLGPTLVVWDRDIVINENGWHVSIQGRVSGKTWDGLDYLEAKGAITVGSVIAIHYVEGKEMYIDLSSELDREMLVALDAQGGDVVLSEYLQVFTEILATVTIR